jgi:UDP-glucose 4-epimerase
MDWIYIDDVVDGMIATAQSRTVDGQAIGLGTGIEHTAYEAAAKIVAFMAPGATLAVGAMPDRQMEKARVCNVADTQAKINWQPAVSFDDGLRRTIAWYRDQVSTGSIALE